MPSEHVWERVLWKRQPFPDNHIPPDSFLSSLRKNPNFRPYAFWPLVLLSCAITQHLATVFIFLSVFVRLKDGSLDARVLVWISVACFFLGLFLWELLDWTSENTATPKQHSNLSELAPRGSKILKSSILTFFALMSLSPVLRTLTAATSSDSIWALSAGLFALNLLLADYSQWNVHRAVQERLTSVLSMNAAISSSVVLASRLSSDLEVFALVLFSVQTFALFPILRHRLQGSTRAVQAVLTGMLSSLAVAMNACISKSVATLYLLALVFTTFVAPAVLVWAQKYKNEIRGPWDVAVPKVN